MPIEQYHKRHIIFVGVPKCGSSYLFSCLSQHPNIWKPRRQRLAYLNKNRPERSWEQYFRKFLTVKRHRGGVNVKQGFYTLDGDGRYFYRYDWDSPRVAKEIVPEAILIFLFRNPVNRLYSNFIMNQRQCRGRGVEINDKIYRWEDLEFSTCWHWYVKREIQANLSNYYEGLKRWQQYYRAENIRTMLYEEMFQDFITAYFNICVDLDIPLIPPEGARCIIPFAPVDAQPQKHYPPLDKGLHKEIAAYFGPQISAFEKLIGRSTPWK